MTEYILKRSNRKTIEIYIKDGLINVRAPLKCPDSEIKKLIASNKKWIIEKLYLSQIQAEKKKAFTLSYGDSIYLRGKLYPIVKKSLAGFDGECFCLPSGLDHEHIKAACIKIYRHLSKIYINERVKLYSKQMLVKPNAVKISSAKRRWGSCSAKKSLNFSWLLIMADDDVIDYVVVHELAHIIHMNHSEKFWKVVKNILPGYKEQQLKLRKLQERLATEDWI